MTNEETTEGKEPRLSLDDTPPHERRVFCSRTLNLRSVDAIGFDMDYTLIHYHVDKWEEAAFDHAKANMISWGWPVEELKFDSSQLTIGLTFDIANGNLIKATRFGYVVKAQHGNRMLRFDEQRAEYGQIVVDLADDRFEFMNTLFEISRASLWNQLVQLMDDGELPEVRNYSQLYDAIDDALAISHTAGALKAEILANPDMFVDHDPLIFQTLVDMRTAGKQLLLITNSDWSYSSQMMSHCFDRYCDSGSTWRDLFDVVIVSADKPGFFTGDRPMYRVVDEKNGLLEPYWGDMQAGEVYFGGCARNVERSLGLSASRVLYVGDHLFGDVHVSKDLLRWRTALIARELEAEVAAADAFAKDQATLTELMASKVELDRRQAQLRMRKDRGESGGIGSQLDQTISESMALDETITPLAQQASKIGNETWGPIMRAGQDKSLFARQVEKYADVYTSRVSNLGFETPYGYIRAARGSLPHDLTSADYAHPLDPA